MEKNSLIIEIKNLANLLDAQYDSELTFRNHCYLRIAYDNTVQQKWDAAVKKPFVKYASIDNLKYAVGLLNKYRINKTKLLLDNEKSLGFRKVNNNQNLASQNTLFNDLEN